WYLDIYNNNNGVKFSVSNIKIEKGTQATPWTPAPEDLGLTYDDGIQSFSFGIKDNILMVSELIEGGIDISTGKGNGMSSSSMYSTAYAPKNLVDGSIVFGGGTAFACANNAPLPQWFQIDLGDTFYVSEVRWINNRVPQRLPGDYRIEISESGEFSGEEVLVASKVGNTSYDWVEHRFADIKCKYVRMTVTKIYAGSYFELAEWQIFGYPAVIDSH
ncbi:MAG TPA: discoidin domain-containing protein, partial [Tissierellaceae bacterium]|nr:discoidin domain-containing protein [Tissierellaceae bacterium]